MRTLLVNNLLDFNEQTLYYWIWTALGVPPLSIQISADEGQAIVQIPDRCDKGNKKF